MFKNAASFDTLRSISAATLGASYAVVGAVLPSNAVCIAFKNITDGDVIVSTDSGNATGMLVFPANSFTVYDIRTNAPQNTDLLFPKGTQFWAKDGTTPSTTGSLYIEVVLVTVPGVVS